MSQFPINVTALPTNVTPIDVTPKTEFNHKCHSSEHRERVDTSSLSFFFFKIPQTYPKSPNLSETHWKSPKTLQTSPKISKRSLNLSKNLNNPPKTT